MTTSPKYPGRTALHALISHKAHEHWHELAGEHGTTVSALLEALTEDLDQLLDDDRPGSLIRRARVEMARRNRRSDR
jgi:hypothetical protein